MSDLQDAAEAGGFHVTKFDPVVSGGPLIRVHVVPYIGLYHSEDSLSSATPRGNAIMQKKTCLQWDASLHVSWYSAGMIWERISVQWGSLSVTKSIDLVTGLLFCASGALLELPEFSMKANKHTQIGV